MSRPFPCPQIIFAMIRYEIHRTFSRAPSRKAQFRTTLICALKVCLFSVAIALPVHAAVLNQNQRLVSG
ncbi:MAG TPA: hypothetical protein VEL78_01615, partial [Pyrinomonadaceae bacterium]|nr:hypothetical protein [Pyrinomonadaceae bacterium]